ncbi:EthD family reductase [Altererythrobacter aerius]|uniref:EthD family reductase n=1 Tax=Tsuneonella aeria TaxID=1837929 RepID=A0A6I4TDY1_9SPHN|nr:EthD domain-containing protein [Tsuneonella aeria]MXO74375.1 EthD family reductase [Tsuneonella aeria]
MSGFKVIALLKRRADITRDAFIRYYENYHAPLILSQFPSITAYRRNFADFTAAFESDAAPFDFDVVTEIEFGDRAGYDAMLARHADPAVAAMIAADEDQFLDRAFTRMFVVETRANDLEENSL